MQRTLIFAILAAFCLAGCAEPERPLPTSVGATPLADAPPGSPLPARSPRATFLGRTIRPLLRRRPSSLSRRTRRLLLRLNLMRILARFLLPSSVPHQRLHWRPARNLRRRPHAHLRGIKAACRT